MGKEMFSEKPEFISPILRGGTPNVLNSLEKPPTTVQTITQGINT
jgi:hypothetical protein